MAVTSPASLSKIHAEFGGSGPLSDYVRGGSYVPSGPSENSSISTTANGLKLSQFVGAIAASNDTLDWANIFATDSGYNANQEAALAADITFSVSYLSGNASISMEVNSTPRSSGYTVAAGDDIRFNAAVLGGADSQGTVTVFSDGTQIDTFTFDIVSGDGF